MATRPVVVTLGLLVVLAGCASSGASPRATTSPSSTSTTAPSPGVTMHWRLSTVPAVPEQHCSKSQPQQCVLLSTETGTLTGDLQGTSFTGSSAAFDNRGGLRLAIGRTDVFRGTVKGCGSGTLAFYGTERADVHRGAGEWRIIEGFGTGDLAHATGHGTGTGTVDNAGYHSQWEGVIDCGK